MPQGDDIECYKTKKKNIICILFQLLLLAFDHLELF